VGSNPSWPANSKFKRQPREACRTRRPATRAGRECVWLQGRN